MVVTVQKLNRADSHMSSTTHGNHEQSATSTVLPGWASRGISGECSVLHRRLFNTGAGARTGFSNRTHWPTKATLAPNEHPKMTMMRLIRCGPQTRIGRAA